jgi:hypothetical protein
MFAPVGMVSAEEVSPPEDGCSNETVQNERPGKIAAQIVAVAGVIEIEIGLERRGYGSLLTSVSAG